MTARTRSLALALSGAFGLAGLGAGTASAAWFSLPDLAGPAASIGGPSVAMAPDGTAFAALAHPDGATTRVGVAMHVPGTTGFGAVRDLSGVGAGSPLVAVDRQGNATLAYIDGAGVETRFRPAGGDWGPVNGPLSGALAGDLSLAVGDNGAAVVAWWAVTTSPASQVRAAVRAPGATTFAPALPLSVNDGSQRCSGTAVAMDAAGDAAAIWTRRTAGPGTNFYVVETATKAVGSGSWTTADHRSALNGFSPCNTAIHMTPGGRVTAMWDASGGDDGAANVAYADRSAPFATGAWPAAPAKLSVPGDLSGRPAFSLDDAGNTAATWIDRTTGQILSSVRTGLGGFSPAQPLSGSTDTGDHVVRAGPNGDAIAVWVAASNGSDAVFSARRTGAAELGGVSPIVTSTPVGGGRVFLRDPEVALDNQGNAFAAWVRDDEGGSVVFTAQAAAFDPVPPTLDAVSVPGAGTATQAVGMSAAASDRMSAPAIHFDFGDGSGADGGGVQHVYAAPGTYTVTVTATDAAGNRTSATRAIVVGAAPVPQLPKPKPSGPGRLLMVSSLSWDRLNNGDTRLKKLVLEGLTGKETIRLACLGRHKGCRKSATRTVKRHGRKLNLTKYVKNMELKPRAVLRITASQKGFITRTISYTMIRHKDPRKTTRCRAPGAKKAKSC